MKKQLYLFTALALSTGAVFGQSMQVKHINEKKQSPFEVTSSQKEVKAEPITKGTGDPVWSDDFSDPSLWTFYDESTAGPGGEVVSWQISSNANVFGAGPADLAPFAPLNFTSVDNGFGFIFADPGGDGSVQNAWIEYTGSIDLTGAQNVNLEFEQATRNFSTTYNVQFSLDDGATWVGFDEGGVGSGINLDIPSGNTDLSNTSNPDLKSINVGSIVGNQPNVRLRFNYNANWGWFWAIDDVKFVDSPDFDLELADAAYDKWLQIVTEEPLSSIDIPEGDTPLQEYYTNMEYAEYGEDQVRPFTFVGILRNLGALELTNVVYQAVVTPPSGITQTIPSEAITLAPGETTLVTIDDITLDAFTANDGGPEVGDYSVSFSAFADQDEGDLLANNSTDDKLFSVSAERTFNGSPTDQYSGAYADADDNEFFNMFTVVNSQEINYIQFALLDRTDLQNEPGEEIFLNIGEGELWGDDDEFPTFFGVEDIAYEIEAESVTQLNDDQIMQWITVMLPDDEVVTLEPGITYFTSLLVPPSSETEPIAVVAVMGGQENAAGAWVNYDEPGGAVQFALGDIVHAVRSGFMGPDNTRNYGPLNFSMAQNFPNPVANGSTRISWELLEAGENISFSITDNTGKTIYSKDLGDRPAGVQEDIVLDDLKFAAGIYQYGINVGNQRIVRKMMVTE